MDREARLYLFIIVILLIALWLIVRWYKGEQKFKHDATALKAEYEKALREGNRTLALDLGRQYYSKLRQGPLTIYDEQAITNDLSTIK